MATRLPPAWEHPFVQPVAPAPAASGARPPFRRDPLVAADANRRAAAWNAPPPNQPTPPVDYRPLPPEPPRRPLELAWLTWQMPSQHQQAIIFNLRQTLNWRAQYCHPLNAPKTAHDYTRFGLMGEQLWPQGVDLVRGKLKAELREVIRTVEGAQSRTERNYLLAMHSVRLGQLCAELEERDLDALELVRSGLNLLWEE